MTTEWGGTNNDPIKDIQAYLDQEKERSKIREPMPYYCGREEYEYLMRLMYPPLHVRIWNRIRRAWAWIRWTVEGWFR